MPSLIPHSYTPSQVAPLPGNCKPGKTLETLAHLYTEQMRKLRPSGSLICPKPHREHPRSFLITHHRSL